MERGQHALSVHGCRQPGSYTSSPFLQLARWSLVNWHVHAGTTTSHWSTWNRKVQAMLGLRAHRCSRKWGSRCWGQESSWRRLQPPQPSPSGAKKGSNPICLPFNKAVLIQANNDRLKQDIMHNFSLCLWGERLHQIDPSLPSGKFAALVNSLPHQHTSTLVQLQTGHVPLNHHLARIGKAPSPACMQCRAAFETIHHYILMCPAYQEERILLRREVGWKRMNVSTSFMAKEVLKGLLKYLAQTWCLLQVFSNLTPLEPPPPP